MKALRHLEKKISVEDSSGKSALMMKLKNNG
jgi:hypothetical protein